MSESVAFGQKMRYFTEQNGSNGRPHENKFWLFSNWEVNVTNRAEKVDEKNGVHLSSFHVLFLSFRP